MLLNCSAGEDSWIPGAARRSNQSILKEITLNIHWKDWYRSWSPNTLANWCKEPTHWKSRLPVDTGKDWGQEEKGETENERVGWHHRINGHEFEQTLRNSEGQGTWHAAVHGVAKSQTRLSNWTTISYILPLFTTHKVFSTLRSWGKHRDLVYTL